MEVLRRPGYLLLSIIAALVILFIILWLPNFSLFFSILLSDKLVFSEKMVFVLSSLEGRLWELIIAILSGINLSLIIYYFQTRRTLLKKNGLVGGVGIVGGFLGVGCASCGSVILSLIGVGGALAFLPFGGVEISFLAIILLLISLYSADKQIKRKIC